MGQKIAIKANINGSAVYDDDISSIFVSQAPGTIDSVGADFLMNEPMVTENNGALRGDPTVENYLHEAGLVGKAPFGTIYTDSQGHLGVHEHWCNSTENRVLRYFLTVVREESITKAAGVLHMIRRKVF